MNLNKNIKSTCRGYGIAIVGCLCHLSVGDEWLIPSDGCAGNVRWGREGSRSSDKAKERSR